MKRVNQIIMTVAGVMLIVAAGLKTQQLLTEPILSKGFWESWLFFVIQIPLELGLGIWLCCGLFKKAGWLLGTIGYGCFCGLTLYKAVTGQASCGCFGMVQVNPWITFATIDVPLFVLLLIFRPKGEKLLPPPWPSAKHFFGVAIPTAILLPAVVLILVFNKVPEQKIWVAPPIVKPTVKPPVQPTIKPVEANSAKNPKVEPNDANTVKNPKVEPNDVNAVKKQLGEPNTPASAGEVPMLKMIDIGDKLRKGIIVVVLYRYDCPHCTEEIPKYDKMSREVGNDENSIRFAFVQVPPYAPEGKDPVPADSIALRGKLEDTRRYIFETPVIVLLNDGYALKYWQVKGPNLDEILGVLAGEQK